MTQRTKQGSRGASAVEYVFVLVFLMIAIALAYRGLAGKTKAQTDVASTVLDGEVGGGARGGGAAARGATAAGGGGAATPGAGAATRGGGAANGGVGATQGAVTAGGGGATNGGGALARAGSTVVSFGKGVVVDGLWGTVKGTAQLGWSLATHPIDTTTGIAKGVGHAVAHPVDTVSGIGQAIKADWDKDPARAIGNGIFQVATAVVPVTKAANVAKIAKGAEEVSAVASAAKKVTQAERLALNEACPGGICRVPGQCFGAGTPITTASGEKPIEGLAVGDVVLARDPESGETSYERVAQTFVREAEVVDLAIATRALTEHLVVTNEHPFFVHGRGFRAVVDLAPGDEVDTASGTAKVVALASLPERRTVYNFEVENAHTYFVGHAAAWVHNACTPPAGAVANVANEARKVKLFGQEITPTLTTQPTARRIGQQELATLLEKGEVKPRGPWAPTPEGRAAQIEQHLAAPRGNTPAYSIRSSVEAGDGTSGVSALKNSKATVHLKPGVEVYDVEAAAKANPSSVEARMAVNEKEIQLVNGYKLSDVEKITDQTGKVIWPPPN